MNWSVFFSIIGFVLALLVGLPLWFNGAIWVADRYSYFGEWKHAVIYMALTIGPIILGVATFLGLTIK